MTRSGSVLLGQVESLRYSITHAFLWHTINQLISAEVSSLKYTITGPIRYRLLQLDNARIHSIA